MAFQHQTSVLASHGSFQHRLVCMRKAPKEEIGSQASIVSSRCRTLPGLVRTFSVSHSPTHAPSALHHANPVGDLPTLREARVTARASVAVLPKLLLRDVAGFVVGSNNRLQ